jgi:hypothetical protein
MTFALVPVFYSLVAIASVWLALLWCARVTPSRRSRRKVIIGAITAVLLLIPFGGLPLWNRAFSFFPNPSLPLLGIVGAALWQRLLGVAVFKPADWSAVWAFGAIAGSGLYLHPMVFGAVDLYYWGWDRESAAAVLAAAAIVLLAWGSRLGVLLLAALIAFAVNTLESQNCWDYVMDPIFWLISVGMIGNRIVARVLGYRTRAVEAGSSPDGVSVADTARGRERG